MVLEGLLEAVEIKACIAELVVDGAQHLSRVVRKGSENMLVKTVENKNRTR